MTCTHRDRNGWSKVDFIKADGTYATAHESHLVQRMWCRKCRGYVPFGHSDETDERVAIEIRAAEIVDRHVNERGRLGLTGDMFEIDGWCAHNTDVDDRNADEPGFRSGYLARVIVEHRELT